MQVIAGSPVAATARDALRDAITTFSLTNGLGGSTALVVFGLTQGATPIGGSGARCSSSRCFRPS
jgi:hypothetical protein